MASESVLYLQIKQTQNVTQKVLDIVAPREVSHTSAEYLVAHSEFSGGDYLLRQLVTAMSRSEE